MARQWLKLIGGFVLLMALLQILFEDVMMFFATTGGGPSAVLNSPYVMVGIPLTISLSLLAVLLGAAFISADALR